MTVDASANVLASEGFARGAVSLAITRGLFGAGESAAFPSSSRALVPWLPKNRRAFGQGLAVCRLRYGSLRAPHLRVRRPKSQENLHNPQHLLHPIRT